MAFWGVELKPGKSFTHNFEKERGRLHLSQATLGTGSTKKKTIVQCEVGDKEPIYVCSLLPEKLETCPLNLEFEEEEDVTFSVIGSHNVHLSGFFYGASEDCCGDEYGSDDYEGATESDSESDDSLEFEYDTEDEEEDGSSDDDFTMYPPSPIPNSGVKIEEILEDEMPTDENGTSKKPKKKKNQSNGTDDSERQIVVKGNTDSPLLESEDEDGFPISAPRESKTKSARSKKSDGVKEEENGTSKKPKKKKNQSNGTDDSERQIVVKGNTDSPLLESEDEDGFPISAPRESKTKSARSKKSDGVKNQDTSEEAVNEMARDAVDERKGSKKRVHDDTSKANGSQRGDNAKQNNKNKKKKVVDGEELVREDVSKSSVNPEHVEANDEPVSVGKAEDGQKSTNEKDTEKKKKNKKNKKNQQDGKAAVTEVEQDKKNESQEVEENAGSKPSHVRTFGNGLVIEDLAMGKPDGKRASPGKKVGVRYIGKLKKNGKIFDSNIGKRPFEFRLGIGQVIKGWDVGVNGMRIGDKRRITIPPAMGYGTKGAGRDIPPNSWLIFDVELINVN
ncbi:hypothetical protein K7X08_020158 [Anisodus acutangulus]|uniref:peptidylprolyl isomerase n=1 Tax=Anisodus acutangulus TaxID=402998 RepID=A0A9Q1M5W6_9SOLA|nr:hypothetical protein K7X08_020158 [Anisodus acutangulus]